MTERSNLAALRLMSELVLDSRTVRLREAAEQRAEILSQLSALSTRHPEDSTDLAATISALDFEAWASNRRSELNLRLAEAQARWLANLDEARVAFARTQVLRRLEQKRSGS